MILLKKIKSILINGQIGECQANKWQQDTPQTRQQDIPQRSQDRSKWLRDSGFETW